MAGPCSCCRGVLRDASPRNLPRSRPCVELQNRRLPPNDLRRVPEKSPVCLTSIQCTTLVPTLRRLHGRQRGGVSDSDDDGPLMGAAICWGRVNASPPLVGPRVSVGRQF